MSRVFRGSLVFALLPALMFSCPLGAQDASPKKEPRGDAAKVQAPVKPHVRVTISKETTYITEPLRKDGYPDYVAWLNRKYSQGVTPENNAAVLFWKAMGPPSTDERWREKFFKMLGMATLPVKGDYFVTSDNWCKTEVDRRAKQEKLTGDQTEELQKRLDEQLMAIVGRPWSKREYPVWADWLAANEKPLALLVEASKRPRRYDPMLGGDPGSAIYILLPGPQASRDVARALAARAMLRANEGRLDEAWQDLLACHRLARLVGQGFSFVEALIANTLDKIAFIGDQRLLEDGRLTSAQIAAMRSDFAKLPPMSKTADLFDVGERCIFLDCAAIASKDGSGGLAVITGCQTQGMAASIESAFLATIDWDIVFRMGNSWFDRLVDAARQPTHDERMAAMAKISADLDNFAKSAKDMKSFGWAILGGPRQAVSERVGQALVALLLPSVPICVTVSDRAIMELDLMRLAFALAAYRADHGLYPKKLADLTPGYIKQVPKDIFNHDGDLHYRRDKDGCLLYSVGVNGKDEDGRSYDAGTGCDDLVVRLRPRHAAAAPPRPPRP